MKRILFFSGILILLVSCRKVVVHEAEESFGFRQPAYFPDPVYPFDQNEINRASFELGRELFYDAILSSDNTVSCANCHSQVHAFADHNVALSTGVNGQLGTRNAPAIFNMAWQPYFMWDGGVNHLEIFPLAPITNPLEMNETMSGVIGKLNASDYWTARFKSVYGTEAITDQQLFRSLAQYMLLIVSDQSLYDRVKRGEANFNADQQAGYELFQNKCGACHQEPLFTDHSFRSNGLDLESTDEGRAHITQNSADLGKFKVPSLRNVLLTYPYMHDGRFFTIDDVLEHYNSGIQPAANLDPLLQNGIPLTNGEKELIKAFLATLSDYQLMANPLLSEP